MIEINHGERDFPQVLAGGCRAGRRERRQRVLDLVSKARLHRPDRPGPGGSGVGDRRCARDLDYWHQQRAAAADARRGHLRRRHAGRCRPWRSGRRRSLKRSGRCAKAAVGQHARRRRGAARRRHDGAGGGPGCWSAGRCRSSPTKSAHPRRCSPIATKPDLVILGGYVYPKTGVALGPLTGADAGRNPRPPGRFETSAASTAKGLYNSNLFCWSRRSSRCCGPPTRWWSWRTILKIGRPALRSSTVRFRRRGHVHHRRRPESQPSGRSWNKGEVRLIVAGEATEE